MIAQVFVQSTYCFFFPFPMPPSRKQSKGCVCWMHDTLCTGYKLYVHFVFRLTKVFPILVILSVSYKNSKRVFVLFLYCQSLYSPPPILWWGPSECFLYQSTLFLYGSSFTSILLKDSTVETGMFYSYLILGDRHYFYDVSYWLLRNSVHHLIFFFKFSF